MASESGRLSGPRDRELAVRRRAQTRVIVNLSDDRSPDPSLGLQNSFPLPQGQVSPLTFLLFLPLPFEISVKIKIIGNGSE